MQYVKYAVAMLVILSAASGMLEAQNSSAGPPECLDPQRVLACQGQAVLTQAGIDGAFSRIPENVRLEVIRDGAKVDKMVQDLLKIELVALDAEGSGFAKDPLLQQRVLLAARKELAEAWMEELMRRAPEADYAAMAHEDYLANPADWSSPATVDVTHILVSTDTRTASDAEKIAAGLRVRLNEDPALFDTLVMEYSDDPGKDKNQGKYTGMKFEQLVKPFAEAAFAMKNTGEISQPVETQYGFHLIRLDGKVEAVLQDWGSVEKAAIEKARAKHLETYRLNYMRKLLNSPIEFPQGSVEVMARRWFGEGLEKAPIFTEEGVQ